MKKIAQYFIVFLLLTGCFLYPSVTLAHQPRIIYSQTGDIEIINPEISQAFYDELKGAPRNYYINSDKDFELYVNLLTPYIENRNGIYSAKIFLVPAESDKAEEELAFIDGASFEWKQYYEEYGRDYYSKGPEHKSQLTAGKYKIEVFSADNLGKYVLAVGQKESYDFQSLLNVYWQLPLLKTTYFKSSVLQFFFTPFGIAGIGIIGSFLIFLALIYFLIGFIKKTIKHREAKTLLLTSSGMPYMQDEIIKLLQKPAYDVNVAFITTAAKPVENIDFLKKDWDIMKELGFNVQEVDIEGKTEKQVMDSLEMKDIIFVEGGDASYLLRVMRECNFEKVIRQLLKHGKVYIGADAGSIVIGDTIKPAGWFQKQKSRLKNLDALDLVPFDISVHYQKDQDEKIKREISNPKKRAKKLRILTDTQGILIQGKEVDLIGDGEAVII